MNKTQCDSCIALKKLQLSEPYLPLNVPLVLQHNGKFLYNRDTRAVLYDSNNITRENLMIFRNTPQKNEVVLQSLHTGKLLNDECQFISIEVEVAYSLGISFNYGRLLLRKFANQRYTGEYFTSEGNVIKSTYERPKVGWNVIFATIPLILTLKFEWSAFKMTHGVNTIPFNIPLHLQSHWKTFLTLDLETKRAWCPFRNQNDMSLVTLQLTSKGKITIRSCFNENYLTVNPNGQVFFISCSNNCVMQCDEILDIRCANQNRHDWEQFKLVIDLEYNLPDSEYQRFAPEIYSDLD
ncbi:hypothetical protein HMI55_000022 [Coelomomyces lativittatus]|nr:hypothetical protein HMI55_000022 [Coelomomyces lativittatus]